MAVLRLILPRVAVHEFLHEYPKNVLGPRLFSSVPKAGLGGFLSPLTKAGPGGLLLAPFQGGPGGFFSPLIKGGRGGFSLLMFVIDDSQKAGKWGLIYPYGSIRLKQNALVFNAENIPCGSL